MYFGSPVAGPFAVGGPVLQPPLCVKTNSVWGERGGGVGFPAPLNPRCSSSLTEATKHLAKMGDEWASPCKCIMMWTLESLLLSTQPH